MLIAKHDLTGKVFFEEYHPKPFDMKRLQSGMFPDRPDLWRKPSKKVKPAPKEQFIMFSDPNELHINFFTPATCSLKGRG